MTKDEVDNLLPQVLPTVRTWVANGNPQKGADSRDERTER
jgi:hypothetical protein